MRRLGRLWLKTKVCGVEWSHRLVSYTTLCKLNDGEECYAVSIEADRTCYYFEDEPRDSLRLLFLHEVHHLPSMSPGETHSLQRIYGTNDHETLADREEAGAVYYARVLAEAAGPFLRLPKPPRKRRTA